MEQAIHIKNMVCNRCKLAVVEVLDQLAIEHGEVKLGSVQLHQPVKAEQKEHLKERLKNLGFELVESDQAKLITLLKSTMIDQVHHQNGTPKKYSALLSEVSGKDYSQLSRIFSEVEGITIEKYITKQKIERVKELLLYAEKSLAEIAFEVDYSSAAYLSTQFKRDTGMTPTQFKKIDRPERRHLDHI